MSVAAAEVFIDPRVGCEHPSIVRFEAPTGITPTSKVAVEWCRWCGAVRGAAVKNAKWMLPILRSGK